VTFLLEGGGRRAVSSDLGWRTMDVDIVVEGVSDPSVAKAISGQIQSVCRRHARSGNWSVLLAPAETGADQWDLGLRGASGLAFAWFAARGDQLPELVVENLAQLLEHAPTEPRRSLLAPTISGRLLYLVRVFQ
jgi:hypothetical protein